MPKGRALPRKLFSEQRRYFLPVFAGKQIQGSMGINSMLMFLPMSPRQEAAKRGDQKYQGAACKNGHAGLRYVSTGQCIDCMQAANKAYTSNIRKLLAEAKK